MSKIFLMLQFVDTAMGVDMKALQNGTSDYVKAVYQVKEAVAVRQRTPWYWPPWIYSMLPVGREVNRNTKLMHDFAYKVCGMKSNKKCRLKMSCIDIYVSQQSLDETTIQDFSCHVHQVCT